MKQIKNLIKFHRIPKLELAEALGLSWYQFDRQIYQDEIEFSTDMANAFSDYLRENHGVYIQANLIQDYSRTDFTYELEPHGEWDGRLYMETKRGYEYDPRVRLQDLVAKVGLPIIQTVEMAGLSYTRMLKSRLLELEEIDAVLKIIYDNTGNKYEALDVASRFVPLDKLKF